MKKGLTFLLVALMLVFSLTACGGNDKQQENQNDSAVVGGDTANNSDNGSDTGSGSTSGNNGNSGNNSGSMAGNDSNSSNGSNSGSGNNSSTDNNSGGLNDALTDDSSIGNTTGGVTYEQMLRNARVHDRDGDLTDHENAATPGTTF